MNGHPVEKARETHFRMKERENLLLAFGIMDVGAGLIGCPPEGGREEREERPEKFLSSLSSSIFVPLRCDGHFPGQSVVRGQLPFIHVAAEQ